MESSTDFSLRGSSSITGQRPSYASPEDWEQHRARITSLYKSHTLKNLMRIMERDYKFRATVSMYKRRFAKWGLGKYNREAEMEEAARQLRKAFQRGSAAKVVIRGKEVTLEDVVRYFGRKNRRVIDLVQSEDDANKSATDRKVKTIPQLSAHMTKTMPTSELLLMTGNVTCSLKRYIIVSIETARWVSVSDAEHIRSNVPGEEKSRAKLSAITDLVNYASQILPSVPVKNNSNYFPCLTFCLSALGHLAKFDHPLLLAGLPYLLLGFFDQGAPELAKFCCRQIAGLYKQHQSERHPLYLVFCFLFKLKPEDFMESLRQISLVAHESFVETLGQYHTTTLNAGSAYMQVALSMETPSTRIKLSEKSIRDYEDSLSRGDLRTLRARLGCAYLSYRNKEIVAARHEAQNVISQIWERALGDFAIREKKAMIVCAKAYLLLTNCERDLGYLEPADVQRRIFLELCKGIETSNLGKARIESSLPASGESGAGEPENAGSEWWDAELAQFKNRIAALALMR